MPIYEYRCESCGYEFERMLKSARENARVACPSCDSRSVEQRLSVFAAGPSTDSSAGGPPACGRCGDPNGPCGF